MNIPGISSVTATRHLAEAFGPDTDDPHVLAVYQRQRELHGCVAAVRDARFQRDRAIRQAVRAGTARELIRRVTGLSFSRISQIAHYRR